MIELLLVLSLLGGGGIFLVKEVKTGFSTSKAIGAKINTLLHGPPSPEKRAELMVSKFAAHVDGLRQGAANLEAHRVQSRRIALEEGEIARQARAAAEEALQKGDKRAAGQLITLAVNSEDRANFLQEKSEKLVGIVEDMKVEVSEADAALEDAKTVADQIRWHAEVAKAYKELYEITSNVSADSGGFSAQGSLKQLAEQTERDAIAAAVKIDFAVKDRSGRSTLRKVLKDSRMEHELAALEQRVALPAGNEDAQEDSMVEAALPDDSDEKKEENPETGEE